MKFAQGYAERWTVKVSRRLTREIEENEKIKIERHSRFDESDRDALCGIITLYY